MSEPVPAGVEDLIRRAYDAFNARDINAALSVMHADVDWPNMLEGTRAIGHDAVRDYWTGQFAAFSPYVDPEAMRIEGDDRVAVDVHQVICDLDGNVLSDRRVQHVYTIRDGCITRMDVHEG